METFSSFFLFGKAKASLEPLAATAKQKTGILFESQFENKLKLMVHINCLSKYWNNIEWNNKRKRVLCLSQDHDNMILLKILTILEVHF